MILVPEDGQTGDSYVQRQIRVDSKNYESEDTEPDFDPEELLFHHKITNPRQTLGMDGIKVEAIKAMHGFSKAHLLQLFNFCLIQDTFTEPWKKGNLKLIRKRDEPFATR